MIDLQTKVGAADEDMLLDPGSHVTDDGEAGGALEKVPKVHGVTLALTSSAPDSHTSVCIGAHWHF